MEATEVLIKLEVETCITCGVSYGIPKQYLNHMKEKHIKFCCPNGHKQYYPAETEEERLRKLFLKEQAEGTALRDELNALKKRVDAGICPHCRRHFVNVERHIKTKHKSIANLKNLK